MTIEDPYARFLKIPLDKLTTPFGGAYCIANHYWRVLHTETEVFGLIYIHKGAYTPQCNINEFIVRHRLVKNDESVRHLPFAYINAYRYLG